MNKYPKTLHLPWSPGVSNTDKVAKDVFSLLGKSLIITEKLDGGCASLEKKGVFARTHAHAPTHPSFDSLKALHATIAHDIPENIQIFGEWVYAKHSIKYTTLPAYFLMFGIRELHVGVYGKKSPFWYSWGELAEWANDFGITTVPVLERGVFNTEKELRTLTEDLMAQKSLYGEEREGVVVRIEDVFSDSEFSKCIMKCVRKGHVAAGDEHWSHKEVVKNGLKKD